MKNQHTHLLLLALTLWSGAITNSLAQSQPGSQPATSTLDQLFSNLPGPENPEEIDQGILKEMKAARIPGLAAVVIKDGKILWSGNYGWANIGQKLPVTEKTFFQVASISKTVTACAIMKLVEKGKLSLDTDLDTILPFSIRNPQHATQPITMKHLLTHTSGIRDNWNILEEHWVKNGDFPESLGRSLANYFKPTGKYYNSKRNYYKWVAGSKEQYSNVAVALAAYAAEVVATMPFEKLCEQEIFQPLGISGAQFRLAGMDRSKIAMPYGLKRKSGKLKELGHHGYLDYPAGTLRITATQLAQFLICFINDGELGQTRVLRAETVQEMRKVVFPEVAPKQGLAWYFSKAAGYKVLGHDGGDPGVSTYMGYRPRDGVGIIILMNTEPKSSNFESFIQRQLFRYADEQR